MSSGFDTTRFSQVIARHTTGAAPVEDYRRLAWYGAAVVVADHELMNLTVNSAREAGIPRTALYEVVLQSYLFVGFPRMLIAGEHLEKAWPGGRHLSDMPKDSLDSLESRRERGEQLCEQIYNNAYRLLRERVQSFAPEIWQWMIEEGYGKVLSRPGLDSVSRELCTVASLMVDLMPRQLHSHMRGALNVGATEENLRQVIADIGEGTADGYRTAMEILARLDRS